MDDQLALAAAATSINNQAVGNARSSTLTCCVTCLAPMNHQTAIQSLPPPSGFTRRPSSGPDATTSHAPQVSFERDTETVEAPAPVSRVSCTALFRNPLVAHLSRSRDQVRNEGMTVMFDIRRAGARIEGGHATAASLRADS